MASTEQQSNFWTTLPGILTAVAGLVTAVTGLFVALVQGGVIGAGAEGDAPTPASSSPTAASSGPVAGEGDALAGTWSGRAADPDGAGAFEVDLQVSAPCRLGEPCGTISVSSLPCTGRVSLADVDGRRFELAVDRFTDDSAPGCTPGAGDFVEVVDDDTLRYSTGYNQATGLLERTG